MSYCFVCFFGFFGFFELIITLYSLFVNRVNRVNGVSEIAVILFGAFICDLFGAHKTRSNALLRPEMMIYITCALEREIRRVYARNTHMYRKCVVLFLVIVC